MKIVRQEVRANAKSLAVQIPPRVPRSPAPATFLKSEF